jgi:hypothetical protein
LILEFHFVADRERMVATVAELELIEEFPAIVAINTRSRQIVAVGETLVEIQARAPEYWARHGANMALIHPFDLATIEPAVGERKPVVAARLVTWFAGHATARWKPHGIWGQIVGSWLDSVDYHLELPAYAQLGQSRRQELVRILRQMLPSVHSLYINEDRVAGRWS